MPAITDRHPSFLNSHCSTSRDSPDKFVIVSCNCLLIIVRTGFNQVDFLWGRPAESQVPPFKVIKSHPFTDKFPCSFFPDCIYKIRSREISLNCCPAKLFHNIIMKNIVEISFLRIIFSLVFINSVQAYLTAIFQLFYYFRV